MRKKEAGDEKVMQATSEANKLMSEPMRKAIEDVKRLRTEREAYQLDIAALQETKAATLVVSDRMEAVKWEHEILTQRLVRLEAERDALAEKFRAAVHEIAQKASFKQQLLEQKLVVVTEERERAALVLGEVLGAANVEGGGGGGGGAGGALQQRDAQIAALQEELGALTQVYEGTLGALRQRMADMRLAEADLGFPLASAADILLGKAGAAAAL
jgi:flagellar biosynthesis regulator FlaF